MHEVIHRWSDGYGMELTFTMIPSGAGQVGTDFCYVTWTHRDMDGDVTVCAHDLRSLAAAAIAMAEAIESNKEVN
jgi:hypothetical protein